MRGPLTFGVETMAKTLTIRAIESLALPETRREVPDGLVNGLYLVVQPSGGKSWAVRYRSADGRPRKYTIPGTYPAIDLRSARELAQQVLVAVARGGDPAAEKKAARRGAKVPADRDLVEKVVEQFIERYAKANTKSWPETKRILDREVVAPWKGKHLADLRRADVHELLDGVVDRGSPVMANRVLAAVRKMCAWAVERGIVETSPCDKVKAPTAEKSRDRVLGDDELKLFWTACDALGWPFGPLFKLLALTGQRRDEVGKMQWSELDLDKALWTLPRERAKNDTQHVIPLSGPALAILRALPRVGPFVFSTNGVTAVSGFAKAKERLDTLIQAAWVKEAQEAGRDPESVKPIPDFVLHDLRRTAATGMARLGIALPVIEKVLNHVSGSFAGIVGVYQRHGFRDEMRHALDAWGGFVERLCAEPGANVVEMRAVG